MRIFVLGLSAKPTALGQPARAWPRIGGSS